MWTAWWAWKWALTIISPSLISRANWWRGWRAVMRRQRETAPATALKMGKLELSPGKREVSWNGAPFELTTSEFDLLENLIRGGETVSSKEELSLKVLGRPREVYDRSVDVHVSNLRKKLAAASGGEIEIETIRGVGYRLRQQS